MSKNIPQLHLSSGIETSNLQRQPPNRLNFPEFAADRPDPHCNLQRELGFSGPSPNSDGLYLRAQMELEDVLGHL